MAGGTKAPSTTFVARDARTDGNGTFYMAGGGVWKYNVTGWTYISPLSTSNTFNEVGGSVTNTCI